MLLGNRTDLAIELTPVQPGWVTHYAPEKAAWAGVSLWVADKNLCAHRVTGESHVTEELFVPLAPIADWFLRAFLALSYEERAPLFVAHLDPHLVLHRWARSPPVPGVSDDEWVDAREAWWSRHFLAAGADGAKLPNVAFSREEDRLTVTWRPPRFASGPTMQMLHPQGLHQVRWADAVALIDEFTAMVANALRQAHAPDAFPWCADAQPLRRTDGDQLRKLELFCGRSRQDIAAAIGVNEPGDLWEALLLGPGTDAMDSPLTQIVRDLPPGPLLSPTLGGAIRRLATTLRRSDSVAESRLLDARATALDAASAGDTPESAGQLAAVTIRERLKLNGHPVTDLVAVAESLGILVQDDESQANSERMLAGYRQGGQATASVLNTVRTRTSWGRRFEQARGIGHLLLDSMRGGALGAASSRFATYTRRRRSGAFAAELLLPENALAAASRGTLDGATDPRRFTSMLEEYGVGARTAAWQLWNRDWLSSESVRDELIEMHAREG